LWVKGELRQNPLREPEQCLILSRLEQQLVERYLDNQFYENVNNPDWRNRLRASHGFCREHAWLRSIGMLTAPGKRSKQGFGTVL
jgi:hypothetical protein